MGLWPPFWSFGLLFHLDIIVTAKCQYLDSWQNLDIFAFLAAIVDVITADGIAANVVVDVFIIIDIIIIIIDIIVGIVIVIIVVLFRVDII